MRRKRKSLLAITVIIMIAVMFFVQYFYLKKDDSMNEFFTSKIMTHAMGGLIDEDGNPEIYNNHKVALEHSIQNGHKVIELDLILTNDEQPTLVCSHGWNESTCEATGIEYTDNLEETMTLDQFMELKIQGKYETMTAEEWSKYVIDNDDIIWELDMRTISYENAKTTCEKLVEIFNGKEYLLDRFLIQVGSEAMYYGINDVYEFKNYQYFLHKAELEELDSVIEFCVENNFLSMAVNYKYMTEEVVKPIRDANLKILCYTVDDIELAQEMLELGADTICSNFLLEEDFINEID